MKKTIWSLFAVLSLSSLAAFGPGCQGSQEEPSADDTMAALRACGLDDGTVEKGARLHACDPQDTKKTTICHIPPGNPANAHTLCIGNAAVPAHLDNHGDYLGACTVETTCQPPPATGGSSGTDSSTGGAPATSTGGVTGTGGVAPGAGGVPLVG